MRNVTRNENTSSQDKDREMGVENFNDFMIRTHNTVVATGVLNFMEARVPLPSKFNFKFLEEELYDYEDKLVIDLLKYGFPLAHNGNTGNTEQPGNHKGAREFPEEIRRILKKEVDTRAVLGPFVKSPFKVTFFLPLNSVPKKESTTRRLILDLSYPEGNSINDGVHKDVYLGEESKLSLPSVDNLVEKIVELGRNCKIFKIDLSRAYHQIYGDPFSYNKLAYMFEDKIYADCTLSMGSRSSARCCQRVSSVVVFIFGKRGHFAINFLDDIGGAETAEKAEEAFKQLRQILIDMGLQEAYEKSVAPCTVMVFLGIQVNTEELTLKIPDCKWNELQLLLQSWDQKVTACLKDVQRLAGLLNFACKCVKSGRIYLSRILNFLRSLPKFGYRTIPQPVREDIRWWKEFAQEFNGVSLIVNKDWSKPDHVVSSDSCLVGGGGFAQGKFFKVEYSKIFNQQKMDINQLECAMLTISLRLWGKCFARERIQMWCDNRVTVEAVQSGVSRNRVIQKCLREIHKLQALYSFELRVSHLEGVNNRISDALSRWCLHEKYKQIFEKETEGFHLQEYHVTDEMLEFVLL